jgi:hypothetical protein
MQQLRLYRIGSLIIDLASVASAGDKPSLAQLPQVVRHRGARHIHQRRNIRHALLAVAQQPEYSQAAAVVKQTEHIGHSVKITLAHKLLFQESSLSRISVIVGQKLLIHGASCAVRCPRFPFHFPFGKHIFPFGRGRLRGIDFPPRTYYTSAIKIKQALNH